MTKSFMLSAALAAVISSAPAMAGQWQATHEVLECSGCSSAMMANTALFGGMMGEHTVYNLQSGEIRSYRTVCQANAEEPCNPYWSYVEEIAVNPQIRANIEELRQFEQQYPGFFASKQLNMYDFSVPRGGNGAEWNVAAIALDRRINAESDTGANYYNFQQAMQSWLDGPNAPAEVAGLRSWFSRLTGIAVGYNGGNLEVNWSEGNTQINITLQLNTGTVDLVYDAKTKELQIVSLRDHEGNIFPAHFSGSNLTINFGTDVNSASAYGLALESADIPVERVGHQYIGSGGVASSAYLNCWYVGSVLKGCEIVYVQN